MNSQDTDLPPIDPQPLDTEAAPRKPRRRKPVATPADVPAPAAVDEAPAAAPADASVIAVAETDPAGVSEVLPEPPGGFVDTQRRPRNRRRGKRGDRERAAPEGGEEIADADGAANAASSAGSEAGDRRPMREPVVVDAGAAFADVLSGAYDAAVDGPVEASDQDEPADPAPAVDLVIEQESAGGAGERRVLAPEPDAPKLHKLLAQSGIGSRRDMEQLIEDGQVTVNEQVAHIGQRISFGDQVRVKGRLVKLRIAPPLARVLAYHKPVGEVVTNDDPQNRPTVFRRLPRLPHGKWQSVGRLDINTEGLLLFTNSGDLANQLMHPRFGVEREYAVRVLGTLDTEARARLIEGVEIEGQRAAFRSIEDGGGEGANHWYRVVITEGRNREVRKLFDRVGLGVSRLIRIRYGCVVLPRGLRRGVFVDLNEYEVRDLRRLAGGREQQPSRQAPAAEAVDPARRNRRRGRNDRSDRNERSDRGPARVPDQDADHHDGVEDIGPIPNPLQQTFDKRAIREARQPRREYSEDGPIPNPLEQTYDKRFVQKQRGAGDSQGRRGGGGQGGQPDPMKTSQGYIGADAFVRKFQGGGGRGGGGGHGGGGVGGVGGGGGGGGAGGGGRGGRRRGGR